MLAIAGGILIAAAVLLVFLRLGVSGVLAVMVFVAQLGLAAVLFVILFHRLFL